MSKIVWAPPEILVAEGGLDDGLHNMALPVQGVHEPVDQVLQEATLGQEQVNDALSATVGKLTSDAA